MNKYRWREYQEEKSLENNLHQLDNTTFETEDLKMEIYVNDLQYFIRIFFMSYSKS